LVDLLQIAELMWLFIIAYDFYAIKPKIT